MKVITVQEPNRFVMTEIEKPHAEAGEALVRILRIGVCGTDLHAYRGRQPFFSYPRVLGHELAAEIVAFGENPNKSDTTVPNHGSNLWGEHVNTDAGAEIVGSLKVGDIVTVIPYLHCGACAACRSGKTNCCTNLSVLGVHKDGGMCEYLSVPVNHLIATELTPEQTATVECFSIGAHAVRRSALYSGETALVIGAGPIGLGVMKFAKLSGARVIAMDINEQRLTFCKEWAEVDETVNAVDDPLPTLLSLTDGQLPSLVFDATGNIGSMNRALYLCGHGGRLVFVGLAQVDVSFPDPEFHKREITLLSSRNATRADFDHVIDMIKTGYVNTNAFVTHRVYFDQVIHQFDSFTKPETNVIKAMIELA